MWALVVWGRAPRPSRPSAAPPRRPASSPPGYTGENSLRRRATAKDAGVPSAPLRMTTWIGWPTQDRVDQSYGSECECLATGMGASPLALRHRIAFSVFASAASGLEKFIRADSFAPAAFFSFTA